MNNTKTHIVIPIGVSQPGTPVLHLLEKSIDSILNQTSKEFILTVAADDNVSDECKTLLESKGVDVVWFSPATFFRKGGIWKKISEVWKTTDTKYISFLHYDDLWDSEKLEIQVKQMENESLDYSWSETYVIEANDLIISGDYASIAEFSKQNVGYKTCALAHSIITKRSTFFDSGILEFENEWSPVWENLYLLYLQKQGFGRKTSGAKFYWRNHNMNMSNSIFVDPALKPIMEEQRVVAEYPNEEVIKDEQMMNAHMNGLIKELQARYV